MQVRGAVMSFTAAVSGFVVVVLSVSALQAQTDWRVTYDRRTICAVEGSTVEISCIYSRPSTRNPEQTMWFTKGSHDDPVDLRTDSQYSDRVEYRCDEKSCTLTITDLRVSDSAEYKFRFTTNQPGGTHTGSPGVTLTVTDVQVIDTGYYKDQRWAQLKCQSTCQPGPPSYIWYMNGKTVSVETRDHISLYRSPEDSYACTFKGSEDFPSPAVCVDGQTCLRVMNTERNICAPKGSSVDISCTYTHHDYEVQSQFWLSSKRSHHWKDLVEDVQYAGRAQVLETESGRSTLRITNLTETDSAQYHFTFGLSWFGWTSSLPATTLTVTALQLQVTTSEVHRSFTDAELKCHSSCSPAARPSYVWFKNGQKVMKEERSSYKCRLNPGDNISCALKGHESHRSASVYAPRRPSVSVSPAEIVEKISVTLTCNSDANPAATYTWYKKNMKPIKPLSTDPRFVFSSIQTSDSGEYYCTAVNKLGRRTSEYITVDVKYAPKRPSLLVSRAEIVENSSVTLTCSSDANAAANYTWYRETQRLSQGKSDIYRFTSISSSDTGNYSCKSENQHGQVLSTSVSIDVQYAPRRPSVSVSPAEIVEKSSVTLTCSSDANPAATYTWYKADDRSLKATGQNFTITDIGVEHRGGYYCEAQNNRGRSRSGSHLIGVAGTWTSAVAIGTTVAAVAVILPVILSISVLIRKKMTSKQSPEPAEGADDRGQRQNEPLYMSVQFNRNDANLLYSSVRAAGCRRHEAREDDSVVYSAVRFNRSQTSDVEAADVVYSTVNTRR